MERQKSCDVTISQKKNKFVYTTFALSGLPDCNYLSQKKKKILLELVKF